MWRCKYCGSVSIAVSDGYYVCRNCGSVLGEYTSEYGVDVRGLEVRVVWRVVGRVGIRYSERVMELASRWLASKGLFPLIKRVYELYRVVPHRLRYRNPRVIAAVLVYEAAKSAGVEVTQSEVARHFGVSKYSLRDALRELRKTWLR